MGKRYTEEYLKQLLKVIEINAKYEYRISGNTIEVRMFDLNNDLRRYRGNWMGL